MTDAERIAKLQAELDAARAALSKATAERDWTHDFDMDVARLRGAQLTLARNRIEELERQLALSPPVRTFADVRGTFADPDFHKLIAERDHWRGRAEKAEADYDNLLAYYRQMGAQDDGEHNALCAKLSAARESRKRAVRLVNDYRLRLRILEYDFGTVEAEREVALERVAELEIQRDIFGEQVEFDVLLGRTLAARCAEYVASATFDVAGVAMEKVPAVPLGQALDELNQAAGELAEFEDDKQRREEGRIDG